MSRCVIVLLALSISLISACSYRKSPSIETKNPTTASSGGVRDTFAYVFEGANGQDSCRNKDSCDFVAVDYPVFKNKTSLNDSIKQIILGFVSGYGESEEDTLNKSLIKRVKNFVRNNTSEMDSSERVPTTSEYHIVIMSQIDGILVLKTEQDQSGGIHPNSGYGYINWDIKKDREILLADVLVEDYQDKLQAVANKIIKEENLNEGLFSGGDTFDLNDNYYFAPEGIHFYYNSYEIKSYMQGTTDLLISYTKIKKLIRPGSVLSQYVK